MIHSLLNDQQPNQPRASTAMTHIVQPSGITKRDLGTLLKNAPSSVTFGDPSIFSPRNVRATEMNIGEVLTVTNHPKRSWFAEVTRVEPNRWIVR